jgi:hypothetical protein
MTIQQIPETSTVEHTDITRNPRNYRWAVPAGLVAVAATAVIGVTQLRGQSDHDDPVDLSRSQVLVQQAIDQALAANRGADFTRSQVLVQDAIDEALTANRGADFTRAQVLVQQAIDEALAAKRGSTSALDSANRFEERAVEASRTSAHDAANLFEERLADAAKADPAV